MIFYGANARVKINLANADIEINCSGTGAVIRLFDFTNIFQSFIFVFTFYTIPFNYVQFY